MRWRRDREPSRVRCAATSCGSKLQRTAIIHCIAELGFIGQYGLPRLETGAERGQWVDTEEKEEGEVD